LKEWKIPEECQMYWDIEDEQFCKSILIDESNISKLKEKHNEEYINKTIKYYTDFDYNITDIFKSYDKMPDLHLITTMFDSQRYEIIKEKIMDSKYGFSFDVLFSLKPNKTEFNYNNEVKTILRYISGSNKEIDFKNGDKSIFTRINKISSRIPFTQIWFLPSDNINEISNCLMKLMKEDGILKHYDVLCINRKNKELAKDVKDEINKQETIARENGKMGLILLAGNMLSLGITINSCDIVMLMNNTLSADKVMQQMYRCMTEGENKKYGFVIDLNISRVLNTCVNYTIYKNSNSIEDKIKYLIENHLINIDVDMMENKKLDSDNIVKKLMDIWKDDPINSFKSLLRNLDNDYVEFDNHTQKLINNSFTNSMKDKEINTTVELIDSEDELQELPTGKEKVKTSSEEKDDTEDDEEKEETKISFTKDVLPYIIPLTCILTIENKNKDFIKMLNDIKEDKQLLEVFDEQCLIWWNKKGLVNFIQDIISKYFDKNSNTYNISIQFKMSIQSLIDRPKELLELINECLKPKSVEKKTFGEVFTSMNLVDEMLDKLPIDVWKNKTLKWFDPSVGMGNFMIAIYLRLMEGLKDVIMDEKERKKHILENMIYMSELNKKNIFVCKQIFDINNEYKLNIYCGDTLKFDINKTFKIKNFDIIIGNPPYQDHEATGDNKLYLSFIKLSLNLLKDNGLLLFITPTNVKNYITYQNKNRNYIDNFYNIKFLSINTANKYFPNIGTFFAYFLIEKKIIDETITKVEFLRNNNIESDTIKIKKGYNLPLCLSSIDINIINKVSNLIENKNKLFEIKKAEYKINDKNTYQRIRQTHIKSGKILMKSNDTFKFKIIDKVNKTNPFPGIFYYNDTKMIDYGLPKVVMCTGGYLSPEYDEKGEYNLSDNMIYMLCKNKKEYDGFKILINSNLINYLNKITMTDNIHGRDVVISNIKICELKNINNENDIYKLFEITKEEINIIEKTLGKKIINIIDTDSSKEEKIKTKPKKSTKSKTMVV